MAQAVISSDDAEQQATLVRRLSVIFSSVSPTISLDYVIMTEGVRVLADDVLLEKLKGQFCTFSGDEAGPGPADTRTTGTGHLSTPPTQALQQTSESQAPPKATEDEDEWDRYWEAEEDISQHFDDFDALEMGLTQAPAVLQGREGDVGQVNEDEEVPTSQPDEEL
jgi:DNA repair protein RAD57